MAEKIPGAAALGRDADARERAAQAADGTAAAASAAAMIALEKVPEPEMRLKPEEEQILRKLKELNVNSLTPLQALNTLNELQQKLTCL